MGNEFQKQYVTYHLHSDFSLLDSVTKFEDYIVKAVSLGQRAICFTEHGNIMHWVAKKMACDKAGIKYLHGCEVYLTAQLEPKVRDNYHTILIAKNMDGLRELNQLVSTSNTSSHFYFKPRISFNEFLNISNNVIKISACLASPLARLEDEITDLTMKDNITDEEKQRLDYLKSSFNDILLKYDYYEIQPHINSKEQKIYNKRLFEWSKKYNKPLIAGTDTHSLDNYKAECRTILQLAKGIEFANEDTFDLTYKSYDELVHMFEEQDALPRNVYLQAIENTNVMADSCEEIILDKEFKYPRVYDDDIKTIRVRLWDMLKDKISKGIIPIEQKQQFINNIKTELDVFKKINMCGFMLFMSDLIMWCHENGIPTGFARGSCFTKNNLVLTQNGYKFINEVNVGELVYTHTGNLRKVLKTQQFNVTEKLYRIHYKGEGSYYKIYPITCTGDHKFLTKRDNTEMWVEASALKVGDKLYHPRAVHDTNTTTNQIIDLNKYNIYGYEYDEQNNIESQWLDIIEIDNEEVVDTTVYDLTVDIDHSFIVNNIAVHNCGGSCVAYILDIIDINPIQWKTVFSRFANEDRKEIGDIDVDFAPDDRDAVYNHMIEKFGEQYTAYILAIGTVSDKGCIDEIGRALYRKTNKEDYSLENIKKIKKEYEENSDKAREKYPELFYYFDGILNTNISQSMHPCGMVVSPITLEDNYGTLYKDDKKILQIDMDDVHEISLVKYDILGLKNVGIIKDTCEYAEINYPKSNEINWNDKRVWDDMLKCPQGIDKLFMYPLAVMLSKKLG